MVVVAPNANMNFMQGFSPAAAATMTAAVADLCASSGLGARADVVIVPAAKIAVGANRSPAPDADAAVGAVVDDGVDDVVVDDEGVGADCGVDDEEAGGGGADRGAAAAGASRDDGRVDGRADDDHRRGRRCNPRNGVGR